MGKKERGSAHTLARALAVAAALTSSAVMAQAGEDPIVTFKTKAQVTIDATGQPTAVVVPNDLPGPVAHFVQQQVMQWRFQAPIVDGQPRGGQTWVALGACAAPVQGGFQLAIDYKGTGPMSTRPDGIHVPPRYPPKAVSQRLDFAGDVHFIVGADGRATYESVTVTENAAGSAGKRIFEPTLRDWVRQMRFDPEYIDGQAVNTRMSVHVTFDVMDDRKRLPRAAAASEKPECRTAMKQGDALRPVAVDAHFPRIETGG